MAPAERMSVLQGMRSLAPLLWSAPYREPVLEGFIASIGGLDGAAAQISLSSHSAAAFRCDTAREPASGQDHKCKVPPTLLAQTPSILLLCRGKTLHASAGGCWRLL